MAHVQTPRRVEVLVDGKRTPIERVHARILNSFDNDGMLRRHTVKDDRPAHLNYLVRRGWAIRTQGTLRLTAQGTKVSDLVKAYYARKLAELSR